MTEAFARVRIDALLKNAGWNLTDGSSVLFEHALPDGTQADRNLSTPLRHRQSRLSEHSAMVSSHSVD